MTEKQTEKHQTEPRYRVREDLSARATVNPPSEEWVEFRARHTYAASAFPAHVDLAALCASGHLEEVT